MLVILYSPELHIIDLSPLPIFGQPGLGFCTYQPLKQTRNCPRVPRTSPSLGWKATKAFVKPMTERKEQYLL